MPDALIRLGYATGEEVMRAMAEQHGLDYVNLSEVVIPPSVVELVPESVARENVDSPAVGGGRRAEGHRQRPGRLRHVRETAVHPQPPDRRRCWPPARHLGGDQPLLRPDGGRKRRLDAPGVHRHGDRLHRDRGRSGRPRTSEVDESSAPIVRLVHLIITEAVQLRASDIHIEPFEDRIRVRYRIDGVLVERDSPPRRLLGAFLSRIKILSKLDIAERRRTQDGRIKVTVGEKELDLRVSVIPTNHGQSVVMRILDKDSIKVGLRQLGFADDDYQKFKGLIRRPNGIILVTGPTGSGKTTSLYAALERAEHAGPEDHHRGGPGRVLLAGGQPGGDPARDWAGFCAGDSGDVAAGPEHDSGG